VKAWLKFNAWAVLGAVILLGGCAVPPPTQPGNPAEANFWRGRLAVRVEPDPPNSGAQAFSAGFELSGNATAGQLTLFTPLGSTAAALSWAPDAATLRANGDIRHFESLDALLRSAVGTELPVVALFAWLRDENMTMAGWSADLSQHANGRIAARRLLPAPAAELKLLIDQ
jgi:outer membrane lipoprotein LolB